MRVASGRLGFDSVAVRRVVHLDVDADAMVDEAVNEDDRTHDRETVASPAGTPDLAATQARTERLMDQQIGHARQSRCGSPAGQAPRLAWAPGREELRSRIVGA